MARRLQMFPNIAHDIVGDAFFAECFVIALLISQPADLERHIEPHGDRTCSMLADQLDRVGAVLAQVMRGVEDDGSIGLQEIARAAFDFGEDCIAVEWIATARSKVDPNLI